MFIELTDILRCPAPHEEQFIVLIPDTMKGRSVQAGRLGCPVCHREYPIAAGMVDFTGGKNPGFMAASAGLESEVLAAFLGLAGSGGYVGLVGAGTDLGSELISTIPAVHFVGVNPPTGAEELPMLSLVRADSIPVKSRSLRGVLLLAPYADDSSWVSEAARAVLPGLRVVGQGTPPDHSGLEILASAGGWWVAVSPAKRIV
jgi:hypothetical protein